MWLRQVISSLLAGLLLLLAGCGYERDVTRRETRGLPVASPDAEQYGSVRLHWVREVRRPTGWRTFPDGGVPLELAHYVILYQSGGGIEEREIGRIDLPVVRRGTTGDVLGGKLEWRAPDLCWYQLRYGFYQLERTVEGEVRVPPLKGP